MVISSIGWITHSYGNHYFARTGSGAGSAHPRTNGNRAKVYISVAKLRKAAAERTFQSYCYMGGRLIDTVRQYAYVYSH